MAKRKDKIVGVEIRGSREWLIDYNEKLLVSMHTAIDGLMKHIAYTHEDLRRLRANEPLQWQDKFEERLKEKTENGKHTRPKPN